MNPWRPSWIARAWDSPPETAPFGAWMLAPLSILYRGSLAIRPPVCPQHAPIPVVSVGSIWSGGAGKTPLAAALARIAQEEGMVPAILIRGYGGKVRRGVARVPAPPGPGDSTRYGDEACLHARLGSAGVYVAADRLAGARAAAEDKCNVAVLDDGLQYRRLARDLEIVTLPAARPLGNHRLLPRGPLREDPRALARADAIVLAHTPEKGPPATLTLSPFLRPRVPIFSWRDRLEIRPLVRGNPVPPPGSRVVLLCGIARPDLFRAAVEEAGYRPIAVEAFRDHHPFTDRECAKVRVRAARAGVEWLLSTEKDAERLPSGVGEGEPAICVASLTVVWNEPDAEAFFRARLRQIVR